MLRQPPPLARTICFLTMLAMSAVLTFGQPAASLDSGLTMGDFLLQYARSMHMTLPPQATPEVAQAALQAVNALPDQAVPLSKPLTHGDVVRLGRAAGLKITSSTPDKSFSKLEADMFFETFAGVLTTHGGSSASTGNDLRTAADSSAPDHANLTKGKKKGRPFQSPNEP